MYRVKPSDRDPYSDRFTLWEHLLLARAYWRVLRGRCPACDSKPSWRVCQICGGAFFVGPPMVYRQSSAPETWFRRYKTRLRGRLFN